MKKIILKVILSLAATPVFSQTTFSPTPVASGAAPWLLNFNPPPGSGRISHLKGDMGPLALSLAARHYADSLSVEDLYNNAPLFNTGLSSAAMMLNRSLLTSAEMGGNCMRSPEGFAWALIEPVPSVYNYRLCDTIVRYGNLHGVHILGTINFYTDSACSCDDSVVTGCPLFGSNGPMYFINNYRTGNICSDDTGRYKIFVQNLVEHYDGDGVDDMPGLTDPVLYWEIGNEPEGGCANGMSAFQYGENLRMAYQAVKAACPVCKVLHAGTIGDSAPLFWDSVYTFYHDYIDIANIHVNAPKDHIFDFNWMQHQVDWINNARSNYGVNWNVWVTEWGIYSGSPDGAVQTPFVSEEEQAGRYAKFYSYGLANHITNWVFDQQGDTASGIGSSALLVNVGPDRYARLSLYTLWLYDSKFAVIDSAKIDLFSTSRSFPTGLIRVFKNGDEYDVVWGVLNLPPFINGIKKYYGYLWP